MTSKTELTPEEGRAISTNGVPALAGRGRRHIGEHASAPRPDYPAGGDAPGVPDRHGSGRRSRQRQGGGDPSQPRCGTGGGSAPTARLEKPTNGPGSFAFPASSETTRERRTTLPEVLKETNAPTQTLPGNHCQSRWDSIHPGGLQRGRAPFGPERQSSEEAANPAVVRCQSAVRLLRVTD